MARKCSKCKKTFEDEELTQHGKKYYCAICDEEWWTEVGYWNELYEYIKKVNYLSKLPISVITLLKKYHSEDGLQFKGMELTYEYIVEIEEIRDDESNGLLRIPLIPYYYDKASEFYGKIFDNEDRETYETEIIKIETTRYSRPKVKKQIDLDSLDMGDDE